MPSSTESTAKIEHCYYCFDVLVSKLEGKATPLASFDGADLQ